MMKQICFKKKNIIYKLKMITNNKMRKIMSIIFFKECRQSFDVVQNKNRIKTQGF